jgi:hypothetical protein
VFADSRDDQKGHSLAGRGGIIVEQLPSHGVEALGPVGEGSTAPPSSTDPGSECSESVDEGAFPVANA